MVKYADGLPLCRPTHFVAVQVSHEPHIVEAIEKVQISLVSHTAGLTGALVDPVTAHMTLMVILAAAESRHYKQSGYILLIFIR
jgi:pterin-4a-carbinolamine dehydratase